MDVKTKLMKVRVGLLLKAVFFGSLLTRLQFKKDRNLQYKTMATDGNWIFFDPDFVESLSQSKLQFVVMHEIMHVVLLTHTRMKNRDPDLWNQATDYAINLILDAAGYKPLEGALLDYQFTDWTAERIYDYLLQHPEKQATGGAHRVGEVLPAGSGGQEGKVGNGKPLSPEQVKAVEEKVKMDVQSAAISSKKAGNLPAGMQKIIDNLCAPKADWQSILCRFVTEKAFADWNFGKAHTRILHSYGIVAPILESEKLGKLAIIVDTSGSVDEEELSQFGGEISDIIENFECEVVIIYCDTEINRVDRVESSDLPLTLYAAGGGGTLGGPAYAYVQEEIEDAVGIIHYSDSFLFDWNQIPEPDPPVLMACTSKKVNRNVPSWVEIIDIS